MHNSFSEGVWSALVETRERLAAILPGFFVLFMIATPFPSQPTPSLGRMMSIGAPFAFSFAPRNEKEIDTGNSPVAVITHGAEPE